MVDYTYNADGVRIGKSGAKTAAYTVCGTQILSENNGSNTTYYLYDESGSPVGLTYKGTTYYYRKNLQGNIINITESKGSNIHLQCLGQDYVNDRQYGACSQNLLI